MSIPGPTPSWTVTPGSGVQINSTALCADGSRALLGTSSEYDSGRFGVYCYDGAGALLWSDCFSEPVYQGVFWVALSADGAWAAAGGETEKDGAGFLKAYRVSDGCCVLDVQPGSRVNEVELSADGSVMAVVWGSVLEIYLRSGDRFTLSDSVDYGGDKQVAISCDVSADGQWLAVGTYLAYEQQGTDGFVQRFQQVNGQLTGNTPASGLGGILRVCLSENGQWWAASSKAGTASLFGAPYSLNGFPLWTHAPEGLATEFAYALALACTDRDEVIVACGSNLSGAGHGCVFALQNAPDTGPTGFRAEPLWLQKLAYDPNPGVNLDRKARWCTATDGQPRHDEPETPGNFYLFDARSGERQWSLGTRLMNWPMAINQEGTVCFGASDTGEAYCWR